MLDHKTSHIQIVYIENNKLKIFCHLDQQLVMQLFAFWAEKEVCD
jgi:hypothetical protein